jgi:hypothetical protein
VPGGRGQVVLNGSEVSFSDRSRTEHRAAGPLHAQNRIEALLVEGRGPGTWRFDLASIAAPGRLRVIAGQVVLVTADSVVFRISGRGGERVVFTFDAPSVP